MQTQKDKQKRGQSGERLITDALAKLQLWNHKLVNYGFGTVFDKIVIPPAGGYALEIKVRQIPRIAHNPKSITNNEVKGLEKFYRLVGQDNAFIIGIWKDESNYKAYLIPWGTVREQVISRVRGSIKMQDFPVIKETNSAINLLCLGR